MSDVDDSENVALVRVERREQRKRRLRTSRMDDTKLFISTNQVQVPLNFVGDPIAFIQYSLNVFALCRHAIKNSMRTRTWLCDGIRIDDFATAALHTLLRLGISSDIDWEGVYNSMSPIQANMLVYYLRFGWYPVGTRESTQARSLLKNIDDHSFIDCMDAVTAALSACSACSACCFVFINAIVRIARIGAIGVVA